MSETGGAQFVEVVFGVPVDHPFTYRIPPELCAEVKVGCRVVAPFGPRRATGVAVELLRTTPLSDLKQIDDVLDPEPVFSAEMLKLSAWIAEYYLCSWGEVLRAALPLGLEVESKRSVILLRHPEEPDIADLARRAPRQAAILRELTRHPNGVTVAELTRKMGVRSLYASLHRLSEQGWLRLHYRLSDPRIKPKKEPFVRLLAAAVEEVAADLQASSPRQAACLRVLASNGPEMSRAELLRQARASSRSLKALEKRGLVQTFDKEILRDYYGHLRPSPPPDITLNPEQQEALNQIVAALDARTFRTFLLHGVTGSGKTQVYIDAIHHVLAQGRSALVLVPEIALTPQAVNRFRSHFHERVAVLHSRMSDGERYDSWRLIKRGQATVVIGPRSAVFAPLQKLGLVVIDEEHDSSYKQDDPAPRYHARDVAIVRARMNKAVVILGSATPSMESYYNARKGKYQLLQLLRRIDDIPMPSVEIVDMAIERRFVPRGKPTIFSRVLKKKIAEKLSRNEQIILLQNRRGFSTCIMCQDCGHAEECENCSITLTYHLRGKLLRCHYCNFTKKAPDVCPKCKGTDIVFRGVGTQRVEEALRSEFPDARVVRMDLDTTRRKYAHDRILKQFEQGKYDILLGTQMVAKGLDFERVSLVGVINADTGLMLPDFRASERTFQLLTQVAGRPGRKNQQGEVIVQTLSPRHGCLLCARQHDFNRFFFAEASERRELNYPPFGRLIAIHFRGEDQNKVSEEATLFAEILKSTSTDLQVLGPTPAVVQRLKAQYRWQVILKAGRHQDPVGQRMRTAVRQALENYRSQRRVRNLRISVDVDPQSLS
jgi:primosomal protein N' (replication factor Y)